VLIEMVELIYCRGKGGCNETQLVGTEREKKKQRLHV
jgi:hypothetical protein